MINNKEILETIQMVRQLHLDVRTTTLGISLFDCISDSAQRSCDKVYDKITRAADKLVATADTLAREIGIPIVNKRISVTPISLITAANGGHIEMIKTLDRAAKAVGIDFLGGYSALVHKGMTTYEREFILSIPEALACTDKVCSSVNIGSTKAGINMDAVALMGQVIKDAAYLTRDNDSLGCAKLVVFCNAVEDNPFMAGAFHGSGEGDLTLNVGVSGPGVVKNALESVHGSLKDVAEKIKNTAFKITRVGQLVAKETARRLGVTPGIVDLSLAPTPIIGDSVAHILEEIGLSSVGSHGTTACLAMLNDAVKKGGIMASSQVGGLSGAFIPVSEDSGMIDAVTNGYLSLDKLEAMTCVCSVGLDMIAIPGDTPCEVISAIIADEAAIGMVNVKTTAVRLIPVYGKGVGDHAEFGGLLGHAPIIAVNKADPSKFIHRGGIIPAPMHSYKN